MADTREGRDKQSHDEEKRQREHDLDEAIEHEEAAAKRHEDHESAGADEELAGDE